MGKTSKLTSQFSAVVSGQLQPDEVVLDAVRVNVKGTVTATAIGAGGGAVVAAGILAAGGEDAAHAGFPTDAQQAIGLTDRRLVVCSRGGFSGRPNQFLASIPLSEIATVEHQAGRMGDLLTFTMASGATNTFECVKVDRGADFAEALRSRLLPE